MKCRRREGAVGRCCRRKNHGTSEDGNASLHRSPPGSIAAHAMNVRVALRGLDPDAPKRIRRMHGVEIFTGYAVHVKAATRLPKSARERYRRTLQKRQSTLLSEHLVPVHQRHQGRIVRVPRHDHPASI